MRRWITLLSIGFFGFVVVWGLIRRFRREAAHRDRIRGEFKDYLRQKHPELKIVAEQADSLLLESPQGGTMTTYLHKVYAWAGQALQDDGSRHEAYRHFIESMLESIPLEPLRREDLGPRLFPRLIHRSMLRNLPDPTALPHQAFAAQDLIVGYVIDNPKSVVFLTRDHLKELGLTLDELHEIALSNLRERFGAEPVRGALKGRLVMVKSLDSFDAARLLLVPEHLEAGETVAAVIPDRDTLCLLPVPADGDWTGIKKIAQTTDDTPLFNRPFRVSAAGFEVIE